jgi:hypothetical protein
LASLLVIDVASTSAEMRPPNPPRCLRLMQADHRFASG